MLLMNKPTAPFPRILLALALLAAISTSVNPLGGVGTALAQDERRPQAESGAVDPELRAEQALTAAEPTEAGGEAPAQPVGSEVSILDQINLLELLKKGGVIMWPIGFMSLLVVAFGLERWLALRRRKVLPPPLIAGLAKANERGTLDPRQAYKLCQQYPSAAANVIRATLLKVGRPHSELEHAVAEANEREADRLYSNVRWLNLAASVSPLLGLLGTVWGMIQAFFVTASLPTGVNKTTYLAQGIYIALVTTLAGLTVAIPATVLAHLFEGRIQRLFRELDEVLLGLLPQLERYEGRMRLAGDKLVEPPPIAAAGNPKNETRNTKSEARSPKQIQSADLGNVQDG
jgi:biopolymer transport protein ExbB